MSANPLLQAIDTVCQEKNISKEVVLETLESALAAAYRKDYGKPNQNINVEFHPETGQMRVFDVKTVMEKPLEEEHETTEEQKNQETEQQIPSTTEATGVIEEEKPRFHPRLHWTLDEARAVKPDAQVGDEIRTELEVSSTFGRMAAQTAKQVIMQKLREAERSVLYQEFRDKEHTVATGIVQRREGRMVLVDFGRLTAIMLPEGQAPHEQYRTGERLRAYVESVELKARGPEVIVSRTSPELVRHLFTVEIPEIHNGSIEIKGIAREAGSRVKIAVHSLEPNIDPVGSCVGQRGSRVQTVIQELHGEKIDIIEWSEDATEYLRKALAPAKAVRIQLDADRKSATMYVAEDQLSVAIGKGGQNVRLASKLTGWSIDIRKEETVDSGQETRNSEQEARNSEQETKEPSSAQISEGASEGEPKNQETEEQSDRGTDEQKNLGTEEIGN